jgi:hypothetical protein
MPNAGEAAAPVPSVDLDAIAAPAFAPADADYESQIEHDKLDREHKTLQNRAFAAKYKPQEKIRRTYFRPYISLACQRLSDAALRRISFSWL